MISSFRPFCVSWLLKWVKIEREKKFMTKLCQTTMNHFRNNSLRWVQIKQKFTINKMLTSHTEDTNSICHLISLCFLLFGWFLFIILYFYAQPNEINCHCILNSIVFNLVKWDNLWRTLRNTFSIFIFKLPSIHPHLLFIILSFIPSLPRKHLPLIPIMTFAQRLPSIQRKTFFNFVLSLTH